MTIPYSLIDHTADFGIHVLGETENALFTNAGMAMFDLIVHDKDVTGDNALDLTIDGVDRADLMVNWLRELLYLWSGEEKLVHSIQRIHVDDRSIDATIRYDVFDPDRHRLKHEIKAVTYHQAQVNRGASCWEARIIFDT